MSMPDVQMSPADEHETEAPGIVHPIGQHRGVLDVPLGAAWDPIASHIPIGFSLTPKGVFWDAGKGDDIKISGPCWVMAETRTRQGGDWGMDVHWIDQDGREQRLAVPKSALFERSSTLVPMLASKGLWVLPGKERALLTYLGSYELPKMFRIQSVTQLGWLEGKDDSPMFVLPQGAVGIVGQEEVVFQPREQSAAVSAMHEQGSLAQWQEFVAKPCEGNPLLVFSLCAAFSGPLLKYAGLDSGGFHLYGASSKGKTTALQVAASVWGSGADPAESESSYINRWNATGNALEAVAASHNDGLLLLDEMATCGARDFGNVVYNLFGGRGKHRLSKNSMLQTQRTWRLSGLSSGEISVRQKIEEESSRKAKTGQLIRLVDVPISSGVISDTGDIASADFVNKLKRACGSYFGTAGPEFLEHLVRLEPTSSALHQSIQSLMAECEKRLSDGLQIETHQGRVIRRFAIAAVAGFLAAQFGVIPLTKGELVRAVQQVLMMWLGDDENRPEEVKGLESVKAFILREQSRFGSTLEDNAHIRNLVGYENKNTGLFLFTDEGFREACGGFSPDLVIDEIQSRGHLFINESKRKKSKHHIEGLGRLRLYAVKVGILSEGGAST